MENQQRGLTITPQHKPIRTKFNRRERRAHLQKMSNNTSCYYGMPIQVIKVGKTHKVIRHRPKPCFGIYSPKSK